MSAFHPALTGVLYGALATHEQALIQMALAASVAQADVDDEIAERYGAVVDGLKRLIAMTEVPEPGFPSAVDATEQMRRKYEVLGHLMAQLPDFEFMDWGFRRHSGIDASMHYKSVDNDHVRATTRAIADRIGVDYVEKRHGTSGTQLIVCAIGEFEGVPVRIWELIEAERPFCDRHNAMVDADGVCGYCRPEMVPDPPTADNDRPFCTEHLLVLDDVGRCVLCADEIGDCQNCGGQHRPPWCADPAGHADRDPNRLGGYTEAQLDWVACVVCGVKFADDETTVLSGNSPEDGRPLRAHPDCFPPSTPTEPPGDAP